MVPTSLHSLQQKHAFLHSHQTMAVATGRTRLACVRGMEQRMTLISTSNPPSTRRARTVVLHNPIGVLFRSRTLEGFSIHSRNIIFKGVCVSTCRVNPRCSSSGCKRAFPAEEHVEQSSLKDVCFDHSIPQRHGVSGPSLFGGSIIIMVVFMQSVSGLYIYYAQNHQFVSHCMVTLTRRTLNASIWQHQEIG
jgi:hypothetical protein